MKRVLPVTFYRCHDCGWRRAKLYKDWKTVGRHMLSLIGYCATITLVSAIVIMLVVLLLRFLGIPIPSLT